MEEDVSVDTDSKTGDEVPASYLEVRESNSNWKSDKTLDKEIFADAVEFEKTKITVAVMAYNEGVPKLQITRQNKNAEGKFDLLKQQNVDTGMGVERTITMLQGKSNVYETELFKPIMDRIKELSKNYNEKSARIVADHIRTVSFVLGEGKGIVPSNVEHGYVLRRLIRRSVRHGRLLGIEGSFCKEIAK